MSKTTTWSCDRCKNKIDDCEDITTMYIGYRRDDKFDLCRICFKKFMEFVKGN